MKHNSLLFWKLMAFLSGYKVEKVSPVYFRALNKNNRLKGQFGKNWADNNLSNWLE